MTNFPETPILSDPPEEHVSGGATWFYDGQKWVKKTPTITTREVELLDPTSPTTIVYDSADGPNKLPILPSKTDTQLDINRWTLAALKELDSHYDDVSGGFVAGIHVAEDEPGEKENGTLWFDNSEDSLSLLMYYDPDGDASTAAWIPASPPVSVVEEINELLEDIDTDLTAYKERLDDISTHGTDAPIRPQDGYIWLDTAEGIERSYMYCVGRLDGTSGWELMSPNSRISDIAPTNPEKGDLWFEPTTTQALSIYNDNQWVQLTVGADGIERIEDIEEDQSTQDGRLDQLELKVNQLESGGGGPEQHVEGGATIDYVDGKDALKLNKSGDTVTGILNISSESQANDDGVRLRMIDNAGETNLTMFPSGVVTAKNVIRVNKDSGDCFQVKDATGSTIKYKVDAQGRIESPRLKLTGGNSAAYDERVIDVKSGYSGRLSYNDKTKLSWGATNVWVGSAASVGESIETIKLNLQNNPIVDVSELKMTHQGSADKKFAIKGELADGTTDSDDFFYSYKNANGTPDAMNYNGKMDSNANLVNKKYVDDAIAGVSTDTFMAKGGDTMTGKLTLNNSSNAQVNFNKGGNSDVEYKGSWIVSFQGDSSPKVKVATSVDMNNKKITNMAAPTGDKDAVTRKSLEGAKITAPSNSNAKSGGFYYTDGRLYYKI